MYPCDPISFKYMKIRGEASYYYAEIKDICKGVHKITSCIHCFYNFLFHIFPFHGHSNCILNSAKYILLKFYDYLQIKKSVVKGISFTFCWGCISVKFPACVLIVELKLSSFRFVILEWVLSHWRAIV